MLDRQYIKDEVHRLYYKHDINCATTSLTCLAKLFNVNIKEETINSAIGLHGAGGFGAQCGLVEGSLMFMGIYGSAKGMSREEIVDICYSFGEKYTDEFGSLRCCELRPGGFNEDDPPHMCEGLTNRAIEFAYNFILEKISCRCSRL